MQYFGKIVLWEYSDVLVEVCALGVISISSMTLLKLLLFIFL